jgi:hypothetical protein
MLTIVSLCYMNVQSITIDTEEYACCLTGALKNWIDTCAYLTEQQVTSNVHFIMLNLSTLVTYQTLTTFIQAMMIPNTKTFAVQMIENGVKSFSFYPGTATFIPHNAAISCSGRNTVAISANMFSSMFYFVPRFVCFASIDLS